MRDPIDYYTTFQRRQEELLWQAASERMLQAAKDKRLPDQQFHRKLAHWLGAHLMTLGQELERYGALGET